MHFQRLRKGLAITIPFENLKKLEGKPFLGLSTSSVCQDSIPFPGFGFHASSECACRSERTEMDFKHNTDVWTCNSQTTLLHVGADVVFVIFNNLDTNQPTSGQNPTKYHK
jgi:hypothetical protein